MKILSFILGILWALQANRVNAGISEITAVQQAEIEVLKEELELLKQKLSVCQDVINSSNRIHRVQSTSSTWSQIPFDNLGCRLVSKISQGKYKVQYSGTYKIDVTLREGGSIFFTHVGVFKNGISVNEQSMPVGDEVNYTYELDILEGDIIDIRFRSSADGGGIYNVWGKVQFQISE